MFLEIYGFFTNDVVAINERNVKCGAAGEGDDGRGGLRDAHDDIVINMCVVVGVKGVRARTHSGRVTRRGRARRRSAKAMRRDLDPYR